MSAPSKKSDQPTGPLLGAKPQPKRTVLYPIPGNLGAKGETLIEYEGTMTPVCVLASQLTSLDANVRAALLPKLVSLEHLSDRELFTLTNTLFILAQASDDSGISARSFLQELVLFHLHSHEGLHLALQVIRHASHDVRFASSVHSLTKAISNYWVPIRYHDICDEQHFLQARYVALRAFDTDTFRDAAGLKLRELLENRIERLKGSRQELAGTILALFRRISPLDATTGELKRLASFIFASGTLPAPPSTESLSEESVRDVYVTSTQAEQRRMYGLSITLDLLQARSLIGRHLRQEEYFPLVRFGKLATRCEPSNESWPTLQEYQTITQVLVLALKEADNGEAASEILALLKILVTRVDILAEDDGGNWSSTAERDARSVAIVAYAEAITSHRADPARIAQRAAMLAIQLLAPEFATYQHASGIDRSSKPPDSMSEADIQELHRIITCLTTTDSVQVAGRLSPDELRLLRKARRLSVTEFKAITNALQSRAISCNWARSAFLEVTKAPHEISVTAQIRTSVLGSLIAEARKIGKLTSILEKEVFAVSAEIPNLEFSQASENSKQGQEREPGIV